MLISFNNKNNIPHTSSLLFLLRVDDVLAVGAVFVFPEEVPFFKSFRIASILSCKEKYTIL